MGRRFLLVGLFVTWPYERGTIMQLALGVLVAISYMAVQLHAQPYRDLSNNYLALLASFNLSLVFVTSIFYKYQTLTELDDITMKLNDEQRITFEVFAVPLTSLLVAAIMGVIVACACILVIHIAYDVRADHSPPSWL